jgi:hypothetical protein
MAAPQNGSTTTSHGSTTKWQHHNITWQHHSPLSRKNLKQHNLRRKRSDNILTCSTIKKNIIIFLPGIMPAKTRNGRPAEAALPIHSRARGQIHYNELSQYHITTYQVNKPASLHAWYLIRRIEVILVFLSGSTSYRHFMNIPENRFTNEIDY